MKRPTVCAALLLSLLIARPGARAAAADEVTIRQALEQHIQRVADLQQAGLGKAAAALAKQQNERGAFHPRTVEARAEFLKVLRQRDELLTQLSQLLFLQRRPGKDAKGTRTAEQWLEQARPKPADVPSSTTPALAAYDYSAIDKHVRATPKDAEESVKALAAHLVKGAKNDREKARAAARWIVDNVAYDYDSVASGKWERDPEALLKLKATDCGGQTALFEALGKACGLEVVSITGKMRDADVDPVFRKYTTTSPLGLAYCAHGWNAVKLDGQWYMVDVTHINPRAKRDGRVEAPVEPKWSFFLVPPQQFIHSRLPDDEKQELLRSPVKKEDHEWLPLARPGLFKHKVEPASHTGPLVVAADELVMTFQAPKNVLFAARLEQDGKEVDPRFCLVEREGTTATLRIVFPREGAYGLGLYARDAASKPDAWEDVLYYRIEATGGQPKHTGFPEVDPLAQERGARFYLPLTGRVKAGEGVSFLLALPGATAASVKFGDKSAALTGKDGIFVGEVKAAAGDLTLFVKYPDQKQFLGLARYKAE
jgi:hypothetical protein